MACDPAESNPDNRAATSLAKTRAPFVSWTVTPLGNPAQNRGELIPRMPQLEQLGLPSDVERARIGALRVV